MNSQIELSPLEIKMSTDDAFVLALMPQLPAFKLENALSLEICGRTILEHTITAISPLNHKQVAVTKTDDILSIVRTHAPDEYRYIIVIYADTPLITMTSVEQALSFAKSFNHSAVKLPRGWIFDTKFLKDNARIETTPVTNLNAEDFIVSYNYAQVAVISAIMRARINANHLKNGVRIIDPVATYIDCDVTVEKGTTIEPNVTLKGKTKIGANCLILANSRIENSEIGEHCTINQSQIVDSKIGEHANIGPFSNLRAGNIIGKNCRITNFVELKNSKIGDGTKIAHMSYVGDTIVGEKCNIGCGVVFCNFNGREKHTTTVGDNVFIGSNSNLIAPLKLNDNCFIAAGSTITDEVPEYALSIARARQAIKENWNAPK